MNQQHVFIIGCKGIPANYGGFETFVDKLTEYRKNKNVLYHVACLADNNKEFIYNHAQCFNVKVPNIGSGKAIYYDVAALQHSINYCKKHKEEIEKPIFYVLACRIGPFIKHYRKKIHGIGGILYVNPDGHEWKRAKWSYIVRKYWKMSERMMVREADLLICDSQNIEKYILNDYSKYKPKTTFIAYGSETNKSELTDNDSKYKNWLAKNHLMPEDYYLVVGRFVPENNFETMIREFMRSKSEKDLVLITNVSEKFLKKLMQKTHFEKDARIKFVGTVYDSELLKKIRENAYGYFHGHEVGGTNPSLLEALGSTELNLLLGIGFNREVAEEAAIYWNKKAGNLADLIDKADRFTNEQRHEYGDKAKRRVKEAYNWKNIVDEYESVFCKN